MPNENHFMNFCLKVHPILYQSELSPFPVLFLAHFGDATPFCIQVDFKMASDYDKCFEKYDFSKLTDSGNSTEIFPMIFSYYDYDVLIQIPNCD